MKAKLRLTNAPLAGEMSGHVFFNDERWLGFDDRLYAAVRLIEILARTDDPSKVLMDLPSAVNTPELQIPMKEGEHHAFIKRFCEGAEFPDAEAVIRVDGLRVEWKDGFALARASNTTPVVVLRFEGDTRKRWRACARSSKRKCAASNPISPSRAESVEETLMSSIADLMHPLLRESAPGGVEAKACGIRLDISSPAHDAGRLPPPGGLRPKAGSFGRAPAHDGGRTRQRLRRPRGASHGASQSRPKASCTTSFTANAPA